MGWIIAIIILAVLAAWCLSASARQHRAEVRAAYWSAYAQGSSACAAETAWLEALVEDMQRAASKEHSDG